MGYMCHQDKQNLSSDIISKKKGTFITSVVQRKLPLKLLEHMFCFILRICCVILLPSKRLPAPFK